jgi:hypothetical protein
VPIIVQDEEDILDTVHSIESGFHRRAERMLETSREKIASLHQLLVSQQMQSMQPRGT